MNAQARKRIAGTSLSEHIGESVILLGKFDELVNGKVFTLNVSSDPVSKITIHLTEPVQDILEGTVEIQGTVTGAKTIQCEGYHSFPNVGPEELDLSLYNDVCNLATKHPSHYVTMT